MKRCAGLWVMLAVVGACGAVRAQGAGGVVGAAGNLERMEIRGLSAEQAAGLRGALMRDARVLRVAAPSVEGQVFVDAVGSGATEALKSAGYRDVSVRVGISGERAVMEVKVGERYVNGKVSVDVPGEINGEMVAAALMKRRGDGYCAVAVERDSMTVSLVSGMEKPAGEPLWIEGEWTHFDGQFLQMAGQAVVRAVREQGRMRGDLEFGNEVDEGAKTAGLRVRVKNLGPKMKLSRTEVRGGRANTQEMVEQFLGVKTGQEMDLVVLKGLFDKLYFSGRFANQRLRLTQVEEDKVLLTVEIEEEPGLPRLDEKLSEADEAMLRFRDWAAKFTEQEEEMVVEGAGPVPGQGRMILSPRDGAFVRFQTTFPDTHKEGASMLVHREALGMRTTDDRRFYAPAAQGLFPLILQVNLVPHQWTFGAGVRLKKKEAAPLTVVANWMPAGFLSIAHGKGVTTTVKDGVLVIEGERLRCRVDAATGRLLEIVARDPTPPVGEFHVTLGRGELARERERLQGASDRNVYEAGHPMSSIVRFAVGAALRSAVATPDATPEERGAAAEVAEKILTNEALQGLEAWLAEIERDREFDVPRGMGDMAMMVMDADSMISELTRIIPPLYAYGSWPWTLQREALLPFDREASAAEWRRLYNDPKTGPLACLAVAECTAAKNPAIATAFAERGRERLTPEALQADLAPLLTGEAPAPQWTREMLTQFRDLPAADVAALLKVLPKDAAAGLGALYGALALHREEPVEKGLPEIVGTMFPVIESVMRARFEKFAPTAAGPPQATFGPPATAGK